MAKTIFIVGYGPGVSAAMAERFGVEGFSVALVARTEAKLAAGVEALRAKGITADAFPADAGDPASIRGATRRWTEILGITGALFGGGSGSLGLTLRPDVAPPELKLYFERTGAIPNDFSAR